MQVISAITKSVDHAKRVLFGPAEFEKWIRFGVIIFLAQLAGGAGGCNIRGNYRMGQANNALPEMQPAISWVQDHLETILMIGIPIMVVCTSLSVVYLWKDRRGGGKLLFASSILLLAVAGGVGIDTLTYPSRHIDRVRWMSRGYSSRDLWPAYWYEDEGIFAGLVGSELLPLTRHDRHLPRPGHIRVTVFPAPDTFGFGLGYGHRNVSLDVLSKQLHQVAWI